MAPTADPNEHIEVIKDDIFSIICLIKSVVTLFFTIPPKYNSEIILKTIENTNGVP